MLTRVKVKSNSITAGQKRSILMAMIPSTQADSSGTNESNSFDIYAYINEINEIDKDVERSKCESKALDALDVSKALCAG